MRFEFATANRIVFGEGAINDLGSIAAGMGQRAFVITYGNLERARPLFAALTAENIEYTVFSVTEEPTTDIVKDGVEQARAADSDMIVGFGGGSVIDTGKAIAALLTNGGEPLDYLEVIGKGQKLTKPSAPYIAVATTAGTGAEVTRNSVLASKEHNVKVSLRSPYMLPAVALVDPTLTYGLPPALTARTGLDALTQVLEPYVSHTATPITDSLCREGLHRAARSLKQAYENGDDKEAREDMAITSLFGGLALANAKLGAVHGFAGPFGGMFSAPHGAVCAALLPHVMAVNVDVLRKRDKDNPALERYDEIAIILTGDIEAEIEEAIEWVAELVESMEIPPLSSYGLTRDEFPTLIEKAGRASSMKGNPIKLTDDELADILERAL